jgi:hypothetical protein
MALVGMTAKAHSLLNCMATSPDYRGSLETKDLKSLMLDTDGEFMCRGHLREIKTGKLAPGVYKVWSVPCAAKLRR